MMESMGLSRSTKWTGYQAHHVIPKKLYDHAALKHIKYDIDDADNGIFLRKADDMSSTMARHQGNHFGYTDAIEDALDKIDLSKSDDAILKEINKIQEIAKKNMQNGTPIRAKDMWNENIFGKDS
ncbi:AHH domain-containing protein [Celerinatantimonas sp. MCCC 1A17872]|uniref:AHH domain-containing protein n=1 Tax=Celerinatantimonas sp. MCCC 1A17872 TaxID=3177514 RepID=UPI0038CA0A40